MRHTAVLIVRKPLVTDSATFETTAAVLCLHDRAGMNAPSIVLVSLSFLAVIRNACKRQGIMLD